MRCQRVWRTTSRQQQLIDKIIAFASGATPGPELARDGAREGEGGIHTTGLGGRQQGPQSLTWRRGLFRRRPGIDGQAVTIKLHIDADVSDIGIE